MNQDTIRQILTILSTIAVITVNALANILPINGKNTGAISDQFQVFFTPAGYVFSIWGIIYIALIAFSVYQALPAQHSNEVLRSIAPYFWLGSLANIVWILLWHYEVFPATVVAMIVLLVTLILTYLRLGIGVTEVSRGFRWFVQIPSSIYLGWITVATIANVTVLLSYLNWDGFGIAPEVWTAIVLLVAVGIAAAVALTRGDAAYGLVLVWAFVGIAAKHPGVPLVAGSAYVAAAIVGLLAVISLLPSGPLPLAR
jgi:hypothetical protein